MSTRAARQRRTDRRKALRAMSKRFGADMRPADKRHHHRLVPLEVVTNAEMEHAAAPLTRLIGWRCADTACTEVFTPNQGISQAATPRHGAKFRIDLPRRSRSHLDRTVLAEAMVLQ